MLMPMTDVTAMLLAGVQADLSPTRVGCAPSEVYEQLSDKRALLDLARSAGIETPRTIVLDDLSTLGAHIRHCEFPLVLKPARSKVLLQGKVLSTSVFIASSAKAAEDHLRGQPWFPHVPCLAQEYIEGHGAGIFALYDRGMPVAWFAHRRLREKPPSGGVSVLSESAMPEESLRLLSERLLSSAGCHGPAMVEYRIGAEGKPYLMEVNCRFWGSLQLPIDSGLDFPWLWLQALISRDIQPPREYRRGRRLRWLLGDIDNLLIQVRDPALPLFAKLTAGRRFVGTFFDLSAKQEIFRWSDPRPALEELKQWVRAAM